MRHNPLVTVIVDEGIVSEEGSSKNETLIKKFTELVCQVLGAQSEPGKGIPRLI